MAKLVLHTQMATQAYEDMLEELAEHRDDLYERLGGLKIKAEESFSLHVAIKGFVFAQKCYAIRTAVEIDLLVKGQFVSINTLLKDD